MSDAPHDLPADALPADASQRPHSRLPREPEEHLGDAAVADNDDFGIEDAPNRLPHPPHSLEEIRGGLAELRRLLVGDAVARVEQVAQRIEDPQLHAQDVARSLPYAIRIRNEEDAQVSRALAPSIEDTLQVSIKKNPERIAEALSPIMMPAIRKSIIDTVKGMIQSLNQTLEQSFSWKGMRWRWEAARTGRPYAEVVMLRSLIYRVEHVLLIHGPSGLLLHHVSAEEGNDDADVVSSMFSAIQRATQDFMRDSFGASDRDQLDTLQVGDYTVCVEQNGDAMIAAVVTGTPPQELRMTIRDNLARIVSEFGVSLRNFQGENAVFQASAPLLEDCCLQATRRGGGKSGGIVLFVLALLIVVVGWWWIAGNIGERQQWNEYLQKLQSEPGIVVVETGHRDGKRFVSGLRDPLAVDPQRMLGDVHYEPSDVIGQWQPYQSLQPKILQQRLRQQLQFPKGMSAQLDQGVLRLTGSASKEWIEQTRQRLPFVTGIDSIDFSGIEQK